MPTFIYSIDWTDQGIRTVKDAPKRSEAARALARKVGVEIKEIYLTTGEHDLLVIADAPLGDHVIKFALALSSLGNVRTSTSRAWSEAEWGKLISELP
ncbi:MAG: GYD domain-containing protein [Pseudomonadota bacterium]